MIKRKIRKLIALHRDIRHLMPEACCYLISAQLYLFFMPFAKLSTTLGELMRECTSPNLADHDRIPSDIGRAVEICANQVPWEAACYPRAIATQWMLHRRGIQSTLYLGVTKDPKGQRKGHAWVKYRDEIIIGKGGHQKYQTVAYYS